MTGATQQLRDWALYLAGLGWCIFPLRPGTKVPALHGYRTCPRTGICATEHQGWEQRATDHPVRVRTCWSSEDSNIAVATGPSGLLVVDCDQPDHDHRMPDQWAMLDVHTGNEVLANLAYRAGQSLPATYTVATPSGGVHYYFRAPTTMRSTAGKLGPLVDTRGLGGYVVAAGSVLPEGGYELIDDTPPADLPGWLVQRLAPEPSVANSELHEIAVVNPTGYVSAALRSEAKRVAEAPSGRQNHTLYEAALALGRFVAGGSADDATVRTVLHRAVSRLPLSRPDEPWTSGQIDATIDSAFRAAANRPRTLTRPEQNGQEAA